MIHTVLAMALLFPVGCAATRNVAHDLQITNRPDFFEFRIGTVQNFTMTERYPWFNPDPVAAIQQRSRIQEGVALLEVRDSDGLLVHSKNLREQGSMLSFTGKPGTWTVTVVFDRASGTVSFQVQGR